MLSDDISEAKSTMDSLIKAQLKYAESVRQDLGRTRDSIIHLIQAELQASQQKQHIRAYAQQASFEKIKGDLSHLLETMKIIPAQDLVLDILWFQAVTTRQRSVDPAHNATFRWLLSETECYQSGSEDDTEGSDSDFGDETERSEFESVSKRLWTQRRLEENHREAMKRRRNRQAFLSWLRIGNGVFYISGKAGAGKSTLMKFMTQEEKTLRELQAWAGSDGKQLILTRFFFWNSGDQLQRSLEGIYRSILWDILRQFPNLIPHAFPDIWSAAISTKHKNTRHHPSFHIELKDLYAALDRIFTSKEIGNQYKLCLFIDGLDEFDGDYWSLSKAISSWSAAAHIKFCISSRPYNEFEKMFTSDPSRHFRLHEMTRQDMFRFVRSEFRDDERSAVIRVDTYHDHSLVEEIVERSDGIFLWTHLVTYEMLKAIGSQCSLAQLHQRLNDIPKGLHGLFRRMVDAIDEHERTRAAQMEGLLYLSSHSVPHDDIESNIVSQGVRAGCFGATSTLYFPSPIWTTWTTLLFAFSSVPFHADIPEEDYRRNRSNLIQLFLQHGADPSVCFILCDVIKVKQAIGDTEKLEGIEIGDIVFYATLPAMTEYWHLPLTQKARELLVTPRRTESGWSFSRAFSLFRATESQK